MNLIRLILRNLRYYRKPYLAVVAGVAISTAVLTGALIVGDSVRFSLERLTRIRLGKTDYALQSNERFFRQQLADELTALLSVPAVPALRVSGMAINSDKELRINQVEVTGVDERFGQLCDSPLPAPGEEEAIISRNTAERLKLRPGDELLLRIRKPGKAPSGAPFVAEKMPSVSVRVKIKAIAEDEQLGRFSLKSNQTAPFNIFLSLKQMSSLLELPGYANLLLVSGNGAQQTSIPRLDSALRACWKPEDAGLHFKPLTIVDGSAGQKTSGASRATSLSREPVNTEEPRWEIITDRIFFDDSTAHAVMSVLPGCQSILTYVVNSISAGNRSTPYSFVTAASESFLEQPLGKRQILITDWLASDLGVGAGDSVMLRYFLMGPLRSLREDSARFQVKSVFPLAGGLSDRGLMPDFPGMSDAGNCRDWETGAPVDLKKIRDKDELYWKHFRGSPKAFISMNDGKKIWGNRFGNFTAFRFSARGKDLPGIESAMMKQIDPRQSGLFFRPVQAEGMQAAANSTDFGELFLSLSFFILLGALLLTSMLFTLLAQSRMAEAGLLSSLGFRRGRILRMFSWEVLPVVLAGVIPGALLGIFYNQLLVFGLNTVWNDAVNTTQIVMRVRLQTMLTGSALGLFTSMMVLILTIRRNLGKPLQALTRGTLSAQSPASNGRLRINLAAAVASIVVALALLAWLLMTGQTMNVALFLTSGGLMLLGGLAAIYWYLGRMAMKQGEAIPGFRELVLRNLSLRRGRTISAVSLLALGTFIVMITGANHKTFYGGETTPASGTGGFLLWGETMLPIQDDLNSPYGGLKFGLRDEEILEPVRYIQFSQVSGDDASCLNLNQVSTPGILGVPASLFDRQKAFSFISTDPSADKDHPWRTLATRLGPNTIPGFADQTVITWGLRKSVGDTLVYRDESGGLLYIKLMGGLDNSIFQGHLLVSDSLLRIFFPSAGASRQMLVDAPTAMRDTITQRLESLMRDQGLSLTPAAARLASFNAVENTYLTVFMMLGGLGMLIGTVGLGIVLLRNIRQRRQELALYLALGFRPDFIRRCILAEHFVILISALLLGMVSSLTGILPSLLTPEYSAPAGFISVILLLLGINGFLWIWFPARSALKKDILPGLRDE